MTFSEAMTYIQGYQKSGKPVHDLSRIQALLEALGNPQEQLQVVHIAGTNGKGSVTAFVQGGNEGAVYSYRHTDLSLYPALYRPHSDRRQGYSAGGTVPVL